MFSPLRILAMRAALLGLPVAALFGCSQSQVDTLTARNTVFLAQLDTVTVAACKIDGQLQPVIVPLSAAVVTAVLPAATPAVAGMVALDTGVIHPVIVAACAAVHGVAVAAGK